MQGAEAILLPCTFFNTPCVAKKRMPKPYRVRALDSKLRKERTRLEARVMHRAKINGVLCPLVLNVDLDKCELIETKLKGVKLSEFLQHNPGKVQLEKAGAELAKLHAAGISHGDSTTSNFMVGREKVYLFDFGLSSFNPTLEEQAIDLVLFSKSVSQQQFQLFLRGYAKERGKRETQRLLVQMKEILSRARYVER